MKKKMLIAILFLATVSLFNISCKKDIGHTKSKEDGLSLSGIKNSVSGHLKQTKTYSSDVAQKWMEMQIKMLRVPAGTAPGPNPYGRNGHRWFAYCGIAMYEAVVPGMPAYQSLYGQLIDMPEMPSAEPGKSYHWPTSANTALAFLIRNFYTTAPQAQKAAVNALEAAINQEYQSAPNFNTSEYERSIHFGKTIAQRIFDWSKTDGASTVYPAYVPPIGPGLWSPTPPNFPKASGPYWHLNRPMVPGSLDGSAPPAPPTYSTDINSTYYAMVKEVYDISQNLTDAQIATANYFRDNPGFQGGTHNLYVFQQILQQENPQLDFYALAQAKMGICFYESFRGCFNTKYTYNMDRPIRYIREVLGHTTWLPFFTNTPGHPDYPSGAATNVGMAATVLSHLFGDNYSFTLHTYDNLGMTPRSYNSFDEMVEDVGLARVYAGIHYTLSCVEGTKQGRKIAENVLNDLKFKKE